MGAGVFCNQWGRSDGLGGGVVDNSQSSQVRPRVLIVDDTEVTREMLQRAADILGRSKIWDISFAASADEARAKGKFDVYVLDIAMPEETGLSLARSIRETDKEAKIIFFTGYDGVLNRQGAEDVGAFAFLEKPLEPSKLFAAIGAALKV